MKKIYVAVSRINTNVGKLKCLVTDHPYNHVSVSFDPKLSVMYSFARQKRDVPLVGGFVTERPSRMLAEGGDVPIRVYALDVSDEEYGRIRETLKKIARRPQTYGYNVFDEALSAVGGRCDVDGTYTDLSFVCKLLRLGDIRTLRALEFILENNLIYEGTYNDIIDNENEMSGGGYFEKVPEYRAAIRTVVSVAKLAVKKLYEVL